MITHQAHYYYVLLHEIVCIHFEIGPRSIYSFQHDILTSTQCDFSSLRLFYELNFNGNNGNSMVHVHIHFPNF